MIVRQDLQQSIFDLCMPEGIHKLKDVDEELANIDTILNDRNEEILDIVERAFIKNNPNSKKLGAKGHTLEKRIRYLILKHLFNWSFDTIVTQTKGSISLRAFTKTHMGKVPDKSQFTRWGKVLTPEVMKEIHALVVNIACQRKITKGKKMRTDTTVTETNVHYPTDATLLSDAIRKICKTIEKIKEVGVNVGKAGRNFQRCTKRKMLRIIKFASSRKDAMKEQFKKEYQELIKITKNVLKNVSKVKRAASNKKKQTDIMTKEIIDSLKDELDHWGVMLRKVITQTEERIIKGNTHFKGKIMSIFEPHTVGIQKGKAGKKIEFGRKIEITECDGKIITDYNVVDGNPYDGDLLEDIVDRHIERFKNPPNVVATDRNFGNKGMEERLKKKGVGYISIPKKGKKSKEREVFEKTRKFKNTQKFRAGGEGTISKTKRRHGLDRCLYKGEDGMERWVGLGVVCNNLLVIARSA